MKKCKKRGGTLKEACQAIFSCVEPGKPNNWACYECDCGKYHIIATPK